MPPNVDDVLKASHQKTLANPHGKIGSEVFKVAVLKIIVTFHDIITNILKNEAMLQDFKDATIFSMYENNGNRSDYGNNY